MRGRDGDPRLLALAGLDGSVALLALWGGVGLMAGAWDFVLPVDWLAPLGLTSWLLPGIALIILIGGSMAAAAVSSWLGTRHAALVSIVAGALLLAWIGGQCVLFGLRAPVQVTTLLLAIGVIALGVAALPADRRSL